MGAAVDGVTCVAGSPPPPARAVFELQAGERLLIGDAIVTLIQKSGRAARLLVEAPRSVPVSNPRAVETSMR